MQKLCLRSSNGAVSRYLLKPAPSRCTCQPQLLHASALALNEQMPCHMHAACATSEVRSQLFEQENVLQAMADSLPAPVYRQRDNLSLLQARFEEGYINEGDPSILRFLIASRDEVSANQLRDDLLSMLVAGHETTGSVLTWTLYLLANNPTQMRKVSQAVGGNNK